MGMDPSLPGSGDFLCRCLPLSTVANIVARCRGSDKHCTILPAIVHIVDAEERTAATVTAARTALAVRH